MAPSLLSLPLELREMIYERLFSSYVVRHGFGCPPAAHRTALLQTCKQIHFEAWPFLPSSVEFHFRGTEAMLDTLLSVDQSVVTRVRWIQVKAFPFPLYATGGAEYYSIYYFSNALSLLPGLHLNRLIVEDAFHGFGLVDGWRDVVTYFDIEALLKSDAWKKLVYITPCTDFIASGYDHRRKRIAQPEGWNSMLQERDGEHSGAVVEMFLTPDQRASDTTSAGDQRPWSARPGHEIVENWRLNTPEQEMKGEVKIVAKRGKRTVYVQTGLSEQKTWKELKEKQGGFVREDWTPYFNDMADAVGWIYGGWGRRKQLADRALNY